MKYLPLRDFEDVTSALNFDTPDLHVIGGCDLYTTKAAGRDKKLYKDIENSLQTQFASAVKVSEGLSPPQAEHLAASLNLSRASPFGSFSQHSSRRTFAYLIATLNASHPDYDFSHVLRPSDFRRERGLRGVMNTIDSTLYNLRPRGAAAAANTAAGAGTPGTSFLAPLHSHRGRNQSAASAAAATAAALAVGSQTPGGAPVWGPRMWRLIDNEMGLSNCSVYCYAPDEDPFDGEEGGLWSLNYFFFNKTRKRVCYLYLRALSVLSHSPRPPSISTTVTGGIAQLDGESSPAMTQQQRKRKGSLTPQRRSGNWDLGAGKRARYWLGDAVDAADVQGGWADDDEDIIRAPGDDEVDADEEFDVRDERAPVTESDFEDAVPLARPVRREKSAVRGMSEHIAETMEI